MLLTVGHGAASQDDLVTLLTDAGVQSLVDVRTAPGSRRHPHVARTLMAQWLPDAGVDYRWESRLGGFRRLPPDSPDVVLRNDSFRAYAAHTRTDEFVTAIDELLAEAESRVTTVMCSEAVWWRCHRRMIADYVQLVRGVEVRHVFHDGRMQGHGPTSGARVRDDGLLVYDAGHVPLT